MSERKVQLIIQWLEENPGTFDTVNKKVQELNKTTAVAAKTVLRGAKSEAERDAVLQATRETHADYLDQQMKGIDGYKMAGDIQKKMDDKQAQEQKNLKEGQKKWHGYGKSVQNAGMRLGWMGFRFVMMGRIMMNYITKPLKDMINVLRNWQSTLENVGYTIGLLGYFGMGSSDMISTLSDTMSKLPMAGLQIQAAFGALEGVFATIAVALAPLLTDVVMQLAEAFLDVWNAVSPVLLPALQQLVDSVLPPLLNLIRQCGPALISGLVNGLTVALPLIIGLIDRFSWLAPLIGTVIGFLIPFAPLLMIIGMALFFVAPILSVIGTLISMLSAVAAPASAGVAALGTSVGAAGFAAAPAIPLILALGAAALMVGAGFLLAGAGVMLAVDSILRLASGVSLLIPLVPVLLGVAAGMLGVAAAGIGMIPGSLGVVAMSVAILALSVAVGALAASFLALAAAAKAFEAVSGVVSNVVGGLTGMIGGLGNALMGLCFKHAGPMAESFNETLDATQGKTVEATRNIDNLADSLRGVPEAAVGAPGGGGIGPGGPQYVTINSEVVIENVTSNVDIDAIQDAVNRGLGEAIRRRM